MLKLSTTWVKLWTSFCEAEQQVELGLGDWFAWRRDFHLRFWRSSKCATSSNLLKSSTLPSRYLRNKHPTWKTFALSDACSWMRRFCWTLGCYSSVTGVWGHVKCFQLLKLSESNGRDGGADCLSIQRISKFNRVKGQSWERLICSYHMVDNI